MTPVYRYDEQRNNVAIATNSFKLLLKASGSPKLEQWLDSSGGKPAFHVAYPASWKSRPVAKPVPGKSAVDILLARGNELAGYVRVKATGVRRTEELLTAHVAGGRLGEKAVELRIALFARGGLVFALSTISVEKSENPVLWMRSKRAYEIALKTVRPSDHEVTRG